MGLQCFSMMSEYVSSSRPLIASTGRVHVTARCNLDYLRRTAALFLETLETWQQASTASSTFSAAISRSELKTKRFSLQGKWSAMLCSGCVSSFGRLLGCRMLASSIFACPTCPLRAWAYTVLRPILSSFSLKKFDINFNRPGDGLLKQPSVSAVSSRLLPPCPVQHSP